LVTPVPSEIKLDDLLAKQRSMNELAATLQGETDTDRIMAIADELRREAAVLAEMARALEAQHAGDVHRRGYTEVVLTEAQRARIKAATGIDLPSVRMEDDAGVATRTMPFTDPRIIEFRALKEAERMAQSRASEVELKGALEEAFAGLESQNNEVLNEQLAAMKNDPSFFGGILRKA
jgi:hypothetical protein